MLNPGFEDLSKRSLLARFIKRYPEIQTMLDGGDTSSASSTSLSDDSLVVSQSSYDKKISDLDELTKEKNSSQFIGH